MRVLRNVCGGISWIISELPLQEHARNCSSLSTAVFTDVATYQHPLVVNEVRLLVYLRQTPLHDAVRALDKRQLTPNC
jgi:hypothetical protein